MIMQTYDVEKNICLDDNTVDLMNIHYWLY